MRKRLIIPSTLLGVLLVVALAAAVVANRDENGKKQPSFKTAVNQLKKDGARLSKEEFLSVGRITQDASQDNRHGCGSGKAFRVYSIEANFGPAKYSNQRQLRDAADLGFKLEFEPFGYTRIQHARAQDRITSIYRMERLAITFTTTAQASKPNLLVTGKTDCLTDG